MGSIDPTRAQEILLERPRLPDVWEFADGLNSPTETAIKLLHEEYAEQLGGLAAGLIQQVTAAADLTVGWAPWDVPAVRELYSLDPRALMTGRLIADLADLVRAVASGKLDIKGLVQLIVKTVRELVGIWTDLLTSVPVVGWIVDLVVGIGFGIWDAIAAYRQNAAAVAEANAVPGPKPSVEQDELYRDVVLSTCETGDWTRIWLPAGEAPFSFSCNLISKNSLPFPHGRWLKAVGAGEGLGVIPGGVASESRVPSAFHESLVMTGLIKPSAPEIGWHVYETGEWYRSASSAAMQAWSLLWGRGPAVFAVDCQAVEHAWIKYLLSVVDTLDTGELCAELGAQQRRQLRNTILNQQGLTADATLPIIANSARAVVAIRALAERQNALLQSDVVAYVDASKAPPALRQRLEVARQALLNVGGLVCHLAPDLIPDPVYRAEVELRRGYLGKGCLFASGVQAPDVDPGPTGFGLARVKLPPPPAAAFPRTSRAGPPPDRAGSSSPTRTTASSPSSGDGGFGGALAISALFITLAIVIDVARGKY